MKLFHGLLFLVFATMIGACHGHMLDQEEQAPTPTTRSHPNGMMFVLYIEVHKGVSWQLEWPEGLQRAAVRIPTNLQGELSFDSPFANKLIDDLLALDGISGVTASHYYLKLEKNSTISWEELGPRILKTVWRNID